MRFEPEVKNVGGPDVHHRVICVALGFGKYLPYLVFQWINLCYGLLFASLLIKVLLKILEVVWESFIQNVHNRLWSPLSLYSWKNKAQVNTKLVRHVFPNGPETKQKRYKNLASMLWSQNTDMYDLLFITDPSRTTLTAHTHTRTHR